jgi:hypothetical protein
MIMSEAGGEVNGEVMVKYADLLVVALPIVKFFFKLIIPWCEP